MKYRNFEETPVWMDARRLFKDVYGLAKTEVALKGILDSKTQFSEPHYPS